MEIIETKTELPFPKKSNIEKDTVPLYDDPILDMSDLPDISLDLDLPDINWDEYLPIKEKVKQGRFYVIEKVDCRAYVLQNKLPYNKDLDLNRDFRIERVWITIPNNPALSEKINLTIAKNQPFSSSDEECLSNIIRNEVKNDYGGHCINIEVIETLYPDFIKIRFSYGMPNNGQNESIHTIKVDARTGELATLKLTGNESDFHRDIRKYFREGKVKAYDDEREKLLNTSISHSQQMRVNANSIFLDEKNLPSIEDTLELVDGYVIFTYNYTYLNMHRTRGAIPYSLVAKYFH